VVLVDTSVWIEVFRKPPRLRLEAEVDFKQVVTALPIVQEVLQGFDDPRPFAVGRDAMLALPVLEAPLELGVFLEAVGLYRSARRAGLTIRSSTDCVIAACALRHDATVLHHDRDFDEIARVSSLRSRAVRLKAT
jgi:predicted nucleic acid-binding protein